MVGATVRGVAPVKIYGQPDAMVARGGNQSIVDGNEWHGSEAGRSREWGQQFVVTGVPRRAFEHQQGNAHVVTI